MLGLEGCWHRQRMKQATLAAAADQGAEFERFRKAPRREVFLQPMATIEPWSELCEVIEPRYPKAGNGRPPIRPERMLRMHFVHALVQRLKTLRVGPANQ